MKVEIYRGDKFDRARKKFFEQLLNQRQVNHKEIRDRLIWGASKSGKYSVKRGYKLTINYKDGK